MDVGKRLELLGQLVRECQDTERAIGQQRSLLSMLRRRRRNIRLAIDYHIGLAKNEAPETVSGA